MDYYSGVPEPTDYDANVNFNKGGNFFKKNSFLVLLILAVVIAILIVVFFIVGDFSTPEYKQLNDDSYLSELVVRGGTLSPDFSKENFEYQLVANSENVSFECTASNKKAKITGCSDSVEVKDEKIVHEIIVEAEDTSISKYKITIIRSK